MWPEDGELLLTGYVFESQYWCYANLVFFNEDSPRKYGWIYIGEF